MEGERTASDSRALQRRVLLIAVAGFVTIGGAVAAATLLPMRRALEAGDAAHVSFAAHLQRIAVSEYLSRVKDTALQFTSRTRIRQMLQRYNAGDLGREELVAFTEPKLAEALRLSETAVGCVRTDASGQLVVSVGTPIPEPLWREAIRAEVFVEGPVQVGDGRYLLAAAPIKDPRGRRVGTDVLLSTLAPLEQLLDNGGGRLEAATTRLTYGRDDVVARVISGVEATAEERAAHLAAGAGQAGRRLIESRVIAYQGIPEMEWTVLVGADATALWARSHRTLLGLAGMVLLLTLVGAAGTWSAMRPVSGRVLLRVDELEARGRAQTAELQAELDRRLGAEDALRRVHSELEARFERRTKALRVANRRLEHFGWSVAHDIRSPLRTISSFAEILVEDEPGNLSADQRDFLERIVGSCRRMDQVLAALLQLAELSALAMVPTELDLGALARETVAELQQVYPERVVDLDVVGAPRLHGDLGMMRILVANLVGNAWRYAAADRELKIELGRRPDGAFYVRDNGPGILASAMKSLFEPFRRGVGAEGPAGLGIGLTLVRQVVERHGGRVWVESPPGEGTTVLFTVSAEALSADPSPPT